MTIFIVINPFKELFLKQTPLGHHLVVAHSLAFSFPRLKASQSFWPNCFTLLLLLFFRHWDLWQVGIVFRSPAIYLGRSLIIREYNGKFSDRITIQTSSLRTSKSRVVGRGQVKREQVDALLFPTNFAGYHDALVNLPHLQNRSRNTAAAAH